MQVCFACAAWSVSSLSMNIMNKEVAMRFEGSTNEIICIQMLVTALIQLPVTRLESGWKRWVLVVPPLFLIMLASSMYALTRVSIGSFVVARNAGPLLAFAFEVWQQKEDLRATRVFLLAGLVAGSILYEHGNLSFDAFGCVFVAINIVSGVAERFCQKLLLDDPSMRCSKATLSVLNNGVASCVMVPALLRVEFDRVADVATWHETHSWSDNVVLGLSCVLAFALSYSGLWVQSLITATEFLVLGCMTKIVLIGVGITVYKDSRSVESLVGIWMSMGCGLLFALRHRVETWVEERVRWITFKPTRASAGCSAEEYMALQATR